MNISTAFNIFVRQALRECGLPFFHVTRNQPNTETIAAMHEAERIAKDPSEKGYTDLNQLFADRETGYLQNSKGYLKNSSTQFIIYLEVIKRHGFV